MINLAGIIIIVEYDRIWVNLTLLNQACLKYQKVPTLHIPFYSYKPTNTFLSAPPSVLNIISHHNHPQLIKIYHFKCNCKTVNKSEFQHPLTRRKKQVALVKKLNALNSIASVFLLERCVLQNVLATAVLTMTAIKIAFQRLI